MKEIMISIKPEYVEKILNHTKTIEIRKTKPSCELPCKVYIYCTKNNGKWLGRYPDYQYCDRKLICLNGKVVAEFTLNKITTHLHNFIDCENEECYNFLTEDVKNAGFNTEIDGLLDFDKFVEDYGKGKPLYAWHIEDLKIYDKPKELSEFSTPPCDKPESACRNCRHLEVVNTPNSYECNCFVENGKLLTRPPQSWCYVEKVGK